MPRPSPESPRPAAARPSAAPFRLYSGVHGGALEAALRRYCVTTTGTVVVEVSDPSVPTARDADVLARLARRLEPFHRSLVIITRSEAGPEAVARGVRRGVGAGPEPPRAVPYTPVA